MLAGYRDMPVRWRHTAEIRDRYGYRDFSAQPGRFAFTAWLYRQAWADEVASSVLFRAAHRQLLARRILLPGHSVLVRLVATVRERATRRVHSRLARAAGPDTPTTRPIAASSTTCSAAGSGATPSPGMSSTASAARSGGTTRSGRKTSSTASAS